MELLDEPVFDALAQFYGDDEITRNVVRDIHDAIERTVANIKDERLQQVIALTAEVVAVLSVAHTIFSTGFSPEYEVNSHSIAAYAEFGAYLALRCKATMHHLSCRDARFTINRPEDEAEYLLKMYLPDKLEEGLSIARKLKFEVADIVNGADPEWRWGP